MNFDQHRGISPMLWAFCSLAFLELLVVHLLLSSRWPLVAWPLTVLSGATCLWLVSWIRSFKRLPHRLDGDRLRLHFGSIRSLDVPLAAIRSVRSSWDGDDLKRPATLNFVPIAYPNRMLLLDPELPGRKRPIDAMHSGSTIRWRSMRRWPAAGSRSPRAAPAEHSR